MIKIHFNYDVIRPSGEEICLEADCNITNKNLQEIIDFIKDEHFTGELVDIPGHVFDRFFTAAQEDAIKQLSKAGDGLYPDDEIVMPLYLPDDLVALLPEELVDKFPDEIFEDEEDIDEDLEDENHVFEFPEPTKDNTLYLPIKQTFFDQIVAGTKKEEYREIKDTTYKKYLEVSEEGLPYYNPDLVKEESDLLADCLIWNDGVYPYIPKDYKYLDLAVGYNKERDTAKVQITGITFEPFINEGTGKPARLTVSDGNRLIISDNGELCIWQIVYHLGDIIELHRK